MPLHAPWREGMWDDLDAGAKGFALKAWMTILVGFVIFFSILAYRISGRRGAEGESAGGAAPAAPVQEFVEVRAGRQFVCDPCGALIEDRTGTVKVPKADAGKYRVEVTRTRDCSACEARPAADQEPSDDYYYGYEPEQRQDTPQPGMAKKLVLKLWGDPIKVEFRRRANRVVERWYFGDPLFRIGSNNRYVEFDENGSVVFVRGMNGLGR